MEFRPFWLEEPLHPEDISGYRALTAESPLPIAAAEAEARYVEFERLVVEGGLDWIQPDPGRCGISTFVEAGKMACRHNRKVVNHSFKSGITIAASPSRTVCASQHRSLRVLHDGFAVASRAYERKV